MTLDPVPLPSPAPRDPPLAETADDADRGTDAAFGRHLVETGRLTPAALDRAWRMAGSTGDRLPVLLTKLGLVTERDLAHALAGFHDLPLADAAGFPTEPVLGDRVGARFLKEARALPLEERDGRLSVAMADPTDRFTREALALVAGRPVDVLVAVPAELEVAIDRLHAADAEALDADPGAAGDDDADIERLRDLASEAPVIRAVNRIIGQAVELNASDVHLEPAEGRVGLRYRIDGVLRADDPPPADMRAALVSRIKIMAGLDIAERRVPQDGRVKLTVRGSQIDLRVSTIPTLHGESVVLRVLDQGRVALDFPALGIDGRNAETLSATLDRPNGIFLVTGPTGSGKTTTLYAALKRLDDGDRKIITVEDPVEYQLDGISQIQVRPSVGLDFASSLRAILRHDPDVILVGEIRDRETATIAAQAALTGHLVLSTLHTNGAAASITRLLDMGVDAYLVTATLNGVSAQRLIRRLCPDCRQETVPDPDLVEHLGLRRWLDAGDRPARLWRPVGCPACRGTGYRGRTTIMETLVVDDEIRRMILKGADAHELHAAAVAKGMATLHDDGMKKALAGVTSVEEVMRVARAV